MSLALAVTLSVLAAPLPDPEPVGSLPDRLLSGLPIALPVRVRFPDHSPAAGIVTEVHLRCGTQTFVLGETVSDELGWLVSATGRELAVPDRARGRCELSLRGWSNVRARLEAGRAGAPEFEVRHPVTVVPGARVQVKAWRSARGVGVRGRVRSVMTSAPMAFQQVSVELRRQSHRLSRQWVLTDAYGAFDLDLPLTGPAVELSVVARVSPHVTLSTARKALPLGIDAHPAVAVPDMGAIEAQLPTVVLAVPKPEQTQWHLRTAERQWAVPATHPLTRLRLPALDVGSVEVRGGRSAVTLPVLAARGSRLEMPARVHAGHTTELTVRTVRRVRAMRFEVRHGGQAVYAWWERTRARHRWTTTLTIPAAVAGPAEVVVLDAESGEPLARRVFSVDSPRDLDGRAFVEATPSGPQLRVDVGAVDRPGVRAVIEVWSGRDDGGLPPRSRVAAVSEEERGVLRALNGLSWPERVEVLLALRAAVFGSSTEPIAVAAAPVGEHRLLAVGYTNGRGRWATPLTAQTESLSVEGVSGRGGVLRLDLNPGVEQVSPPPGQIPIAPPTPAQPQESLLRE